MAATLRMSMLMDADLDVVPPVMILVAWSTSEPHPNEGPVAASEAELGFDEAEPTWEDAEWQ